MSFRRSVPPELPVDQSGFLLLKSSLRREYSTHAYAFRALRKHVLNLFPPDLEVLRFSMSIPSYNIAKNFKKVKYTRAIFVYRHVKLKHIRFSTHRTARLDHGCFYKFLDMFRFDFD